MKTIKKRWFYPLVILGMSLTSCMTTDDPGMTVVSKTNQQDLKSDIKESSASRKGKKLKDRDGNEYSTVQIGTQLWMAENLKTTKYNDGSDIPLVIDNTAWSELSTGAYCWWNNDENINIGQDAMYNHGALYNWYAVETTKLCPSNWHVPSDADWNTLSDYLGGNSVSGGKMKSVGTEYWSFPNTGATNESGFSGLPTGVRISEGFFAGIGTNADFWSSSEKDASTAYPRDLQANTEELLLEPNGTPKEFGFAVRCLMDNSVDENGKVIKN